VSSALFLKCETDCFPGSNHIQKVHTQTCAWYLPYGYHRTYTRRLILVVQRTAVAPSARAIMWTRAYHQTCNDGGMPCPFVAVPPVLRPKRGIAHVDPGPVVLGGSLSAAWVNVCTLYSFRLQCFLAQRSDWIASDFDRLPMCV
jgi:hypothetical protein